MADKTHKNLNITQLNDLFLLLVKLIHTEINHLTQALQLDTNTVLTLVSDLKHMGLDISIKANNVHLLNNIDILDIELLITTLNKHHINKPLSYYFASDSTNNIARNHKSTGIYLADYQYEGKGRRKKKWLTPLAQSVALSISYDFNFSLQQLTGLNIAVGVAILNTAAYFNCNNIGVKWPNDVLRGKEKVAGILIEATGNTQKCRAIIGIGLNWNVRQELLDIIDQDCCNIDIKNTSRTEFIAQLIIQVADIIKEFSLNGLTRILPQWQSRDLFTGQTVNILQDNITHQAKYIGVNLDGSLQIETSNQSKTIASGEVSIKQIND